MARHGGSARPLKVVVIERNKTQCNLLRRVLEAEGDLAVVAVASGAKDGVAAVKQARPDVVTLDLQIEGGGIEAIAEIMRGRATPILVLSVAVQGMWRTRAVDALAAGAADVLPKPLRWDAQAEAALRDRVRAIGRVRLGTPPPPPVEPPPVIGSPSVTKVVAMAASTGGPAALARVLGGLAALPAPVLVVQHLHPDFMSGFVTWLNRVSALPVKAARSGEHPRAGVVYVAPGGAHLRLGGRATLTLDPEPPRIHRPSADELFESVAAAAGADAVGVLLTGMGTDGAAGLLAIHNRGGTTIVQDEATSAVFGMPRAAIQAKAADRVVPLDDVAGAVRAAVGRSTSAARSRAR
jgi:two-component system chemotaxis response regulator CheB